MPLKRVPEPESGLSRADALEYAAISRDAEISLFSSFLRSAGEPEGRLLDIGCGPAEIPAALSRQLPRLSVTALESSPVMLDIARERLGKDTPVSLLQADARDTGLAAGSFDWIICNNLVHHMPDPLPLFREIARLAAPGAGLFIRDLLRPESDEELEAMADHRPDSTPRQRDLLRLSMRAALLPEEAGAFAGEAGLSGFLLEAAGPRHWELRRPRLR